jgi:hypothetical protein
MSASSSEPSLRAEIQRAADLLASFLSHDHASRQFHWQQVKDARAILQAIPVEPHGQ